MASKAIKVTRGDLDAALSLCAPWRSAPGVCRALTISAELSLTFTEWLADGTKREIKYRDPLEGAVAAQEGTLRFHVVQPPRVPARFQPRVR